MLIIVLFKNVECVHTTTGKFIIYDEIFSTSIQRGSFVPFILNSKRSANIVIQEDWTTMILVQKTPNGHKSDKSQQQQEFDF